MEKETTGKAGKEPEGWLQWQRHPRRRVSDESVRPPVRSAALFGLALAPRFLPLREHDPSEPACDSAPPSTILPSAWSTAAGRVSARACVQSAELQALTPSFPHAPPISSLKPEPDWPAPLLPLWPPASRQTPPQPLHLLSIFQECLTKPLKNNIQHTHTQNLYIQIIFFQLKGYETGEEKACVQSTILIQTLLYLLSDHSS